MKKIRARILEPLVRRNSQVINKTMYPAGALPEENPHSLLNLKGLQSVRADSLNKKFNSTMGLGNNGKSTLEEV